MMTILFESNDFKVHKRKINCQRCARKQAQQIQSLKFNKFASAAVAPILVHESESFKYINLVSWYSSLRQDEKWLNLRKKFDNRDADDFISWINNKLENTIYESFRVKNLYDDLSDGLRILYLIEILYNYILIKEKSNTRLHKIKNFQTCIDFMETKRSVKCVGISSLELADGNHKILLGLLFLIRRDYENLSRKTLQPNSDVQSDQIITESSEITSKKSNKYLQNIVQKNEISDVITSSQEHIDIITPNFKLSNASLDSGSKSSSSLFDIETCGSREMLKAENIPNYSITNSCNNIAKSENGSNFFIDRIRDSLHESNQSQTDSIVELMEKLTSNGSLNDITTSGFPKSFENFKELEKSDENLYQSSFRINESIHEILEEEEEEKSFAFDENNQELNEDETTAHTSINSPGRYIEEYKASYQAATQETCQTHESKIELEEELIIDVYQAVTQEICPTEECQIEILEIPTDTFGKNNCNEKSESEVYQILTQETSLIDESNQEIIRVSTDILEQTEFSIQNELTDELNETVTIETFSQEESKVEILEVKTETLGQIVVQTVQTESPEESNDVQSVQTEEPEESNQVPTAPLGQIEVQTIQIESPEESNDVQSVQTEEPEESNQVSTAPLGQIEVQTIQTESPEESNDVQSVQTEDPEETNEIEPVLTEEKVSNANKLETMPDVVNGNFESETIQIDDFVHFNKLYNSSLESLQDQNLEETKDVFEREIIEITESLFYDEPKNECFECLSLPQEHVVVEPLTCEESTKETDETDASLMQPELVKNQNNKSVNCSESKNPETDETQNQMVTDPISHDSSEDISRDQVESDQIVPVHEPCIQESTTEKVFDNVPDESNQVLPICIENEESFQKDNGFEDELKTQDSIDSKSEDLIHSESSILVENEPSLVEESKNEHAETNSIEIEKISDDIPVTIPIYSEAKFEKSYSSVVVDGTPLEKNSKTGSLLSDEVKKDKNEKKSIPKSRLKRILKSTRIEKLKKIADSVEPKTFETNKAKSNETLNHSQTNEQKVSKSKKPETHQNKAIPQPTDKTLNTKNSNENDNHKNNITKRNGKTLISKNDAKINGQKSNLLFSNDKKLIVKNDPSVKGYTKYLCISVFILFFLLVTSFLKVNEII